VLKSFFLAGFEGTTGYNVRREWVDQVAATRHDEFVREDYRLLTEAGIWAARESVRWPLVDRAGRYDFCTIDPVLDAAAESGVEVIYDLFHFGFPDYIDLFSAEFPLRFADYCHASASHIASRTDGICYFTPINEPSYFSWAAGEVGLFAPHRRGCGWDLKLCLTRAAIAGINAIRDACPDARIVNVDPVCRVAAPRNRPDLRADVENFNNKVVFQSWDILSGRLMPEFGGSPSHLDIVGVNYYWTNQWDLTHPGKPLNPADPRCIPLGKLVESVSLRYDDAPLLITETSHVGVNRARWLCEVVAQTEYLLNRGVPLQGVCLYPVTSMPEWHDRSEWVNMGLWDLDPADPLLKRVVYRPLAAALRRAQQRLDSVQDLELQRLTG
jgi:hypothetical protein